MRTSAQIFDGAGGDSRAIHKALAGEFQFFRVTGIDQCGGGDMRQVTDIGEDAVVLGGRHYFEKQPRADQKSFKDSQRAFICVP